ncbi:MAG: hypothetical protein G01um101433_250 [Parcubacteria group bacterium Gr01-1014_33]|nr:MAG: hypothetical protein G01um101433_250 [Parcubacteria group bacterium Gr01-1014_33]
MAFSVIPDPRLKSRIGLIGDPSSALLLKNPRFHGDKPGFPLKPVLVKLVLDLIGERGRE